MFGLYPSQQGQVGPTWFKSGHDLWAPPLLAYISLSGHSVTTRQQLAASQPASQPTECPLTPMWAHTGGATMEIVDKFIWGHNFCPLLNYMGPTWHCWLGGSDSHVWTTMFGSPAGSV